MNPVRSLSLLSLASLVAVAGCPQLSNSGVGVVAKIGVSTTRGTAPLHVFVSGQDSTSTHGDITAYQWDFAGLASADTVQASYNFANPGRYTITLTVTDSAGGQGVATVEVRVASPDATAPTAVIKSDVSSGAVPLSVHFDGTSSSATNDEILDYYWDFGDSGTSREPKPLHVYLYQGTYTVELKVVTAGGLEGSTTATINAGSTITSLQFDGDQLATLPVTAPASLDQLTFEGWFKADGGGGTVFTMGGGLKLDILPATNMIRLTVAGTAYDASTVGLASGWHRVAFTYDRAGQTTTYLDDRSIATATIGTTFAPAGLIIGSGFRGKLGGMALWSTAGSTVSITAGPTGGETGLLGYWPIDEAGGQTLHNRALSSQPGYLGTSSGADAADPAWSSDGPP